jgi:hypothetical protein
MAFPTLVEAWGRAIRSYAHKALVTGRYPLLSLMRGYIANKLAHQNLGAQATWGRSPGMLPS